MICRLQAQFELDGQEPTIPSKSWIFNAKMLGSTYKILKMSTYQR
jgi:hypothetical protein